MSFRLRYIATMQIADQKILFSAGDVVNFLECEHRITLSLEDLIHPLPKAEEDESAQLVMRKGVEHESAYLAKLEGQGLRITRIGNGAPTEVARQTIEALRAGPDIIYQAAFLSGTLYGRADFLRRIEEPSNLGAYSYEVLDLHYRCLHTGEKRRPEQGVQSHSPHL